MKITVEVGLRLGSAKLNLANDRIEYLENSYLKLDPKRYNCKNVSWAKM